MLSKQNYFIVVTFPSKFTDCVMGEGVLTDCKISVGAGVLTDCMIGVGACVLTD